MISSRSLMPAEQITTEFLSRGLTIYPVSTKKFGDLVSSFKSVDLKTEDLMQAVLEASKPYNGLDDTHGAKRDALADHIASYLDNICDFCMNTINPTVREIAEKVERRRDEIESTAQAGGVKVVPLSLHPILESETLDVLLESANTNARFVRGLSSSLFNRLWAAATVTDIAETMMTGSEIFNGELAQFIGEYYPGGSLKSVQINGTQGLPADYADMFTNNGDLVAYLFLRGVYAGKHPSVDFAELEDQEKRDIQILMQFWAGRVLSRIEDAGDQVKSGRVVCTTRSANNQIMVYQSNYTKWLQSGGTAKALIGYWLGLGKRAGRFEADTALAMKQENEETYERSVRQETSQVRAKVNAASERLIIEEVLLAIEEHIEDTTLCGELKKKANKFYTNMKVSSFDSIEDYITFCVCMTIGKDSDALDILRNISEYGREHPEAPLEEAVLDSISMRLATYLADNMAVVGDSFDTRGMQR